MAMNQWVAEMFGTAGAGQDGDEGQAKTAQLELFAKLAADEGIDLTTLSPEQVNELWNYTFSKTAQEGEEGEEGPEHEAAESPEKEEGEKEEGDDDDEKEAAARAEHEEKKAQVAKLAEAELMGQVMAHSLVRELHEIEKSAAMPAALKKGLSAAKGLGGKAVKGAKEVGKDVSTFAHGASRAATPGKGPGKALARSLGRQEAMGTRTSKALAAGGAAGTVGGAGYLAGKKSGKKEASAFDTLAAENAIKLAAAAGYDANQAYERINSVYTLGLEESEKVAFVEDTSDAIHVRSLEYLERAGYPVNWEEVFGG